MSAFNYVTTLAYVKATKAANRVKDSITEFNKDERGLDGIVTALILIAIAAAVAIVFRDKIGEAIQTIAGKLEDLFNTSY